MTDDERAHMPNSDERPDASPDYAADAAQERAREAASEAASQTESQPGTESAGAPWDATAADEHADAAHDAPLATSEAPAHDASASAPAPDGAAGSGTAHADALASEVAALKEQVAQLVRDLESERDHATDYMQQWQRAQADLSNFRRRVQHEEEQFANMAAMQAMALVLPALDSFERAFKTLPESLQRLTWIEGIFLVETQLRHTLEAHGVTPFEPKPGDPLDAARHQPVAQAETTDHPEGTVVEALQSGYELHGRVLRPALVRIARAPAATATPSAGAPEGGATSGSGPPPGSAAEGGAGP